MDIIDEIYQEYLKNKTNSVKILPYLCDILSGKRDYSGNTQAAKDYYNSHFNKCSRFGAAVLFELMKISIRKDQLASQASKNCMTCKGTGFVDETKETNCKCVDFVPNSAVDSI